MPASYTVQSEHPEGQPLVRVSPRIKREDYHAMEFEPITVTSWPRESELPQKPHFVNIYGEAYAVTRTANKRFFTPLVDYLEFGNFSQIDDYGMKSWKSAGEDNRPNNHNLIPKMPNLTYITEIAQSPMNLDIRDTAVDFTTKELVNAVNPNDLGRYVSKNGYTQDFLRRNLLLDDTNRIHYEIGKWIDFLDEKGYPIDKSPKAEIFYVGTENDVANQRYLVFYYPNLGIVGNVVDFHDKVQKLMSRFGLNSQEAVEAMMRADYMHEVAHSLGVSGDRKGEQLQGELRRDFYLGLAQEFKGTKYEEIYRALALEGVIYAERYSLPKTLWRELNANPYPEKSPGAIELLVKKFEVEADALELTGLRRRLYINERLEDVYGPLLAGTSVHRKSKNKKYLDREKRLEEIVDELAGESTEYGIDSTEYVSTHLPEKLVEYLEGREEKSREADIEKETESEANEESAEGE